MQNVALNMTVVLRVSENDRIVMQINASYFNFLTNLDDRFCVWCLSPSGAYLPREIVRGLSNAPAIFLLNSFW